VSDGELYDVRQTPKIAHITFQELEYRRLRGELQAAHEASQLLEASSEETRAALNDLLIRARLVSRWVGGNEPILTSIQIKAT
jgi:hypothetical protein